MTINLLYSHSRTLSISWDIPISTIHQIESHYHISSPQARPTIRLYDVTDCLASPPRPFLMYEWQEHAPSGERFIAQLYDGRCYAADWGIYHSENNFVPFERSLMVRVGWEQKLSSYPIDPFELLEKEYEGTGQFSAYTWYGEGENHSCSNLIVSENANAYIGEKVLRDSGTLPASPRRRQGPLRLAMLAWEYPPHIVGGLGRAVSDLARHLAGQGLTVHVFTCTAPSSPAEETLDGVHVHRVRVPASPDPIHFWDRVMQMNFALAQRLAKLDSDEAFDLIHAHDWLVFHAASQSAGALQLPLIATVHATEHGRRFGRLEPGLPTWIHELECQLMHSAAHVIVCSEAMRTEITSVHGVHPQSITVIPCGMDIPSRISTEPVITSLPTEPPAPPTPNILFVGRLVYEKGIHILLDAMPALIKHFPELHLCIAGVGPMESQLREQAQPIFKHVSFVGWADELTKQQLFNEASLCIIPSLYEPFGIVALEAMSYGIPPLISSVGGLTDIVTHGVDGWHVPAGNSHALANAIIHLLTHSDIYLELHHAAKHTIQYRYVWSHFAQKTIQIYQDHLPTLPTNV
ncbi:glycosyltransferase [Paenibacillus sp. KN14-4R]|uniref:glycosyltransferase n=1 Tax=Paenibacillus sp. KN14-4R TaxID=3445773 RepID=UPI003FA00F7F